MPDYSKGKIYRLVGGGLVYYGSTVNELRFRLRQHKCPSSICRSKLLFETGDKVEIVLVEYFPCENKMELTARERWYIENNECVNKIIPTRTDAEYYQDNKNKIIKQTNQYYHTNKDYCKIKQKERYDKTKKEQYNKNRERLLERRQNEDEYLKMKEYHRNYMRTRRLNVLIDKIFNN